MAAESEHPLVVDFDQNFFGEGSYIQESFINPDADDFYPKPALRGDSGISFDQTRPFKASSIDTTSPESSAQESPSESPRGRKRKASDDSTDLFFSAPGGPFDEFKLDPSMDKMQEEMDKHFDFNSAATSPGVSGPQTSGDAHSGTTNTSTRPSVESEMPLSYSKAEYNFETSPMTGSASPANPLMSYESLDAATTQNSQSPVWPTSGENIGLPPNTFQRAVSPKDVTTDSLVTPAPSKPRLTIHQSATKTRVEVQTRLRLVLTPVVAEVKRLHLPLYTIGKPKQMSKDKYTGPDTLQLTTSLVCTSAMQNEELRKRALERAAAKAIDLGDRTEYTVDTDSQKSPKKPIKTPRRGSTDSEDSDNPENPLNGAEVQICANCMHRESKRTNRRKIKNPNDEIPWRAAEADRVVVFNCNEYQDWKKIDPADDRDLDDVERFARDTDGMIVELPTRITCYCRHQSEKIGFQIIVTIKDHKGNVVAQELSKSILITDDHKTHSTQHQQAGQPQYLVDTQNHGYGQYGIPQYDLSGGLSRKHYSYNDLTQLQQPYLNAGLPATSALGMNVSQPMSNPVTPHENMSRQTSPSAQAGNPNKKRKPSSGIASRLPLDLSMTPTNHSQAPVFPPGGMMAANEFMTSQVMPTQMGTAPTTPRSPHGYIPPTVTDQAYAPFSAPSSARPSRAGSPVATSRPHFGPFAGYMPGNMVGAHAETHHVGDRPHPATVNKIIPAEGPTTGGIEITCLGTNFDRSLEVVFGEQTATATTFWGENTLVCLLPPSTIAGTVPVTIKVSSGHGNPSYPVATDKFFTYVDDREKQLYEIALRTLYFQDQHAVHGGQNLQDYARTIVSTNRNGMNLQNAFGAARPEDVLMNCLDILDLGDNRRRPKLDAPAKSGATMLSLACSLGFMRFSAGLLARGADVNSKDRSGFTPLMMAVMYGHTSLVRFLILKGADPMLRTYRGYTAHGLAKSQEMSDALFSVGRHHRSRSAGHASLRRSVAHLIYTQQSQRRSGRRSGYSSEDEYESDSEDSADDSITPPARAWARSRRNSTIHPIASRASNVIEAVQQKSPNAPAWVDQLSAQFHQLQNQFQQMQHGRVPAWNFNFQLPGFLPVPNLEAYQDSSVVRRISSLVPHRSPIREVPPEDVSAATSTSSDYTWRDFFSLNSSPPPSRDSPPPPAYDEIYPENKEVNTPLDKKTQTQLPDHEALADRLCEMTFDQQGESSTSKTEVSAENLEVRLGRRSISKEQEEKLRLIKHHQKMKKIQHDRKLFLIWLPLMLFILGALLKNFVPQAWSGISTAWETVSSKLRDESRVVELT